MNVVVDTSVLSVALRRNTPNDAIVIVNTLRDLITDGRVVLLGEGYNSSFWHSCRNRCDLYLVLQLTLPIIFCQERRSFLRHHLQLKPNHFLYLVYLVIQTHEYHY